MATPSIIIAHAWGSGAAALTRVTLALPSP